MQLRVSAQERCYATYRDKERPETVCDGSTTGKSSVSIALMVNIVRRSNKRICTNIGARVAPHAAAIDASSTLSCLRCLLNSRAVLSCFKLEGLIM